MYVKSIESNVKKGAKTELGRLTLIVGPNGGGKSSIVNGVELALTGRASDVVGRAEVAKGIDLLTLAPAADDALWANVRLSDGREASWRCERNTRTGGAREATHSLPNGVKITFPVRAVREALAGAPATVRAWLVGRIGSTVSEEAIRGLIPEDLHAPYADLIKPLFGYPAQVLLDAREAAAKQARNAGTDAKAANALAEQTGANLAGEPSEEDVEAARHRVREAAVAASAGSAPRPARFNLAALRAQAEVKIKLYADFDAEAARLQGILDTTPAVNADVVRIRDALTRVLVFTAQKDAADCLICNSAVPHGAHAAMLQRAETLTRAAQGDVVAVEAQARLGLVQTALADAQGRAEEAVRGFRDAEAEDARIAALPEAAASQGDALAALRAAEEQVRALEGARAAWSNVRAAKARARDLSARQRVYADLHTAIEDAIVGVLDRARSGFAKKVQSYLPAEDAFDLVLDDNGKDVCKFGFTRDGVLHTALSGAEWARLTLALAAAVTSDEEADLAVLTPEDRAFDPETLASVMRALGNAPGQVLLCSPVAPAGRTPKGWTIIDLTAPKVPKGGKKADEAATFDSIGEAK
jgi:energy-coupling factor transporter ATP-binding protein EcfA2